MCPDEIKSTYTNSSTVGKDQTIFVPTKDDFFSIDEMIRTHDELRKRKKEKKIYYWTL